MIQHGGTASGTIYRSVVTMKSVESTCGGIYSRVYCILEYVYDVVVKKVHVPYLICW